MMKLSHVSALTVATTNTCSKIFGSVSRASFAMRTNQATIVENQKDLNAVKKIIHDREFYSLRNQYGDYQAALDAKE